MRLLVGRVGMFALFAACQQAGSGSDVKTAPLVETARAALPGVEGRLDHCAYDAKNERLFVAALGNGTIEVVEWRASDVPAGRVSGRIEHLEEPQGIAFLPAEHGAGELAFTTGGDGKLHVVDAVTLKEKMSFQVGGDADNVRVDSGAGLLYVGCEGELAVVDIKRWEKVGAIALAGHAESFQLDPASDRAYVNVPGARHVAVVDTKARKVVQTWPTGDAAANYPMALDAKDHRLYVACREPACLLVLDTTSGKRVARLAIGGDCDDVFLDESAGRLYASCGSGVVSVIAKQSPDEFAAMADVPTTAGARTSLFAPGPRQLFVIVPHRGSQRCEVRVLEPSKASR